MLQKSSYNCSLSGVIFTALLGVVFLSSIAVADINDQMAQLDFDTATLDDIIDIFGEPLQYLWGGQTYTRDNLPAVYIARYPDGFDIVMIGETKISELRFYSPSAYSFRGELQIGSPLSEVLEVLGQPTETVVGQPIGGEDGVLYKDINGQIGYCYYSRSDHNVRMFFLNYNISALYVTGNVNGSDPPPPSVNEFDDVRSMDLSILDLSGREGLIETLSFNQETIWPEPSMMPAGSDPNEIMTNAMNPGLGVRALHQQGIIGTGINVAIIDQPIYQDHPEYDGKIAAYYDTGCGGSESSMHGPAVSSLLVGNNCGTAPGANVYYVAAPSWLNDTAYEANGLDWIIAQNEALPISEKIRVVSVSASPSSRPVNGHMWDEACARAEAAGILVLDCTDERGFINRAWYALDDPENVAKCTAGSPGYPPITDTEGIHVPASCRTTAQHYDYHARDSYIYWGRGGLSWSIPYCAGVLAMGWQIRPELTGEQMVDYLFQTAYVNGDGAKIINPSAFINLLVVPVDVSIDIKPGSCPNPLNVQSSGVLPVAILGSEDFDVNMIDVASIRLDGVAPIRSSYEDVATPVSDGNECECTTEGPDGHIDLTLKFKTQELVEKLVNKYDELVADEELILTLRGALYDETLIEGSDCIVLVGNVPKWLEAKVSDLNEDGIININDFAIMAGYWLESTVP